MTLPQKSNGVFEHAIHIHWADCDPANIVYTGNFPRLALEAIEAWWEHFTGHGWYVMELDHNIGTPFVSIKMDLRKPVTPRHELICRVWPNRLGKTSLGFHVEGYQDGALCFTGDFVSVFITTGVFEKTEVPERFRKIIEAQLRAPDDADG